MPALPSGDDQPFARDVAHSIRQLAHRHIQPANEWMNRRFLVDEAAYADLLTLKMETRGVRWRAHCGNQRLFRVICSVRSEAVICPPRMFWFLD